jgi:hypothetical protein
MKLSRKNSRLIALIACFAMLLNSLAPAISHAMASTQGNANLWQEVCSAAGNKTVLAVDLGTQKPANDQDSKPAPMQHCPYCVTHAGSFALVAHVPSMTIAADLSYSLPELFYHAPRPLFSWAASHPRAPPVRT